jgi:hypothetical protein
MSPRLRPCPGAGWQPRDGRDAPTPQVPLPAGQLWHHPLDRLLNPARESQVTDDLFDDLFHVEFYTPLGALRPYNLDAPF